MDVEKITHPYSTPTLTLLLKFDANQEFAREVDLAEYITQTSGKITPVSDLPVGKTISLKRLPPWTDPDSIQNLFQRVGGGVPVKVKRIR